MIFGPGNSSLQLGGVGPDGGASGALTNAAGGTIDFQAAAGIVAGDGVAPVTNAGTLTNSPDTGTTTISVELDNTGTVVAASGTLFLSGSVDQISGGTLEAGTWIVDSAATLAFARRHQHSYQQRRDHPSRNGELSGDRRPLLQ